MAYWIVVTFDGAEEAGKVRESLRSVQGTGHISLDDSAVVVRDAEGKVQVKNEFDRGTKTGIVGGSLVGLLIGTIIFPLGGIILGGLAGGLIGATANIGIDKKFIKEVQDSLEPNSSALFVIVREADPGAAVAALSAYKGKIYHTSLPSEAEETLRKAMK
jgi:uncharacterized membrane protein